MEVLKYASLKASLTRARLKLAAEKEGASLLGAVEKVMRRPKLQAGLIGAAGLGAVAPWMMPSKPLPTLPTPPREIDPSSRGFDKPLASPQTIELQQMGGGPLRPMEQFGRALTNLPKPFSVLGHQLGRDEARTYAREQLSRSGAMRGGWGSGWRSRDPGEMRRDDLLGADRNILLDQHVLPSVSKGLSPGNIPIGANRPMLQKGGAERTGAEMIEPGDANPGDLPAQPQPPRMPPLSYFALPAVGAAAGYGLSSLGSESPYARMFGGLLGAGAGALGAYALNRPKTTDVLKKFRERLRPLEAPKPVAELPDIEPEGIRQKIRHRAVRTGAGLLGKFLDRFTYR